MKPYSAKTDFIPHVYKPPPVVKLLEPVSANYAATLKRQLHILCQQQQTHGPTAYQLRKAKAINIYHAQPI